MPNQFAIYVFKDLQFSREDELSKEVLETTMKGRSIPRTHKEYW